MNTPKPRPVAVWAFPFFWGLVLSLVLLGWVQWRQYQLLYDTSARQVDRLMWQAAELLRERDRLAERLRQVMRQGAPVDVDALSERYEIFVSRIDLLDRIPRRDLLQPSTAYEQTMEVLRAFVAGADPLWTDPQTLAQHPEQLRALLLPLQTLEPMLTSLTAHAHQAGMRWVSERNLQLQRQNRLLLGLGLTQALVVLLLVLAMLRHIRLQGERNTHLQRLSTELQTARDSAFAANRAKDVFLATVSHELRTPFQGLMGMLQLLRDSRLDSRQRDYLETARQSSKHLLGVLNDILDISTLETGTLKLNPAPTPLPLLLEQVEALMQGAAHAKGLRLRFAIDPQLPNWVMADAKRVRQVLFNLLGNAIKFTREGEVSATVAVDAEDPEMLIFTIRDSGIGMDEETLTKLFTRFYQADNSLRRRVGGTGLGLDISRNLARLMDGDITVSSELGRGAVFTVRLRLPPATPPQRPERAQAGLAATPSLRLLMAEDNPINRKVMLIMMDRLGHQVRFCEDGQQALDELRRHGAAYDAVLLDYHMPILDGITTTEAIRMLPAPLCNLPIIMVTADVLHDTRQRAMQAGVTEFATKPLQPEDLQRAFKRCGLLPAYADSGLSVLGQI